MKLILASLLIISTTVSFAQDLSDPQEKCLSLFTRYQKNYLDASIIVMEKLLKTNLSPAEQLKEEKRILEPSNKILNSFYKTCHDPKLDHDQIEAIKVIFK